MKKFCILAALVLLLAPISAMAGMSIASNEDLQDVTGQTGVTISMTMNVTATGVGWGDDDGFLGYTTEGWVVLRNVSMPSISLSGVDIDVGGDGTTSYIAISTYGNIITGNLTIGDLVIGSSATSTAPSAGEIRVQGIGIGFGTIRISGH
jgi:hypothetical protein